MTKPFNPATMPLGGAALIEANAGCGKTWSLTDIYLRLILEADLAPRNILVMSYTVAATEELRDRIRRRLAAARSGFAGRDVPDPFIRQLVQTRQEANEQEIARRKLDDAIRSFDEAAIYTIHGFCFRVLMDYAFETGGLFEMETLDLKESFLDEFIDDHRRRYNTRPEELVALAKSLGFNNELLRTVVKKARQNPWLEFIPPESGVSEEEFHEELKRLREEVADFRRRWEEMRGETIEKLSSPALNGSVYGQGKRERIVKAIDVFLRMAGPSFPLPEEWKKITASYLKTKTNRGKLTPESEIFNLADVLHRQALELAQKGGELVHNEIMRLIDRGRAEGLKKAGRLSYEDLLLKVHRALDGDRGGGLAEAIRGRYRAALIDEFQDTDEIQYSVFRRIFTAAGITTFFIGDPKQAIYTFRGADLFSYLKAGREIRAKYSATVNWRSDDRLIKAVNRIFSLRPRSFAQDEIDFFPSSAAPAGDAPGTVLPGLPPAPMQVWYIADDDGTKTPPPAKIGLTEARPRVAAAITGEIKRLLKLAADNKAFIAGRPLQAGDIAILVRKNAEAELIRKNLAAGNVKSVVQGVGSIYATDEAREMERLLLALAAPDDRRLLTPALATRYFGLNAQELDAIVRDSSLRTRYLPKLSHYAEIGREKGFMAMFCRLLDQERVRERVISLVRGREALGNIFHLAELLDNAERQKKLSLPSLSLHLAARIQSSSRGFGNRRETPPDEEQLRPESDGDAVKVVTIHKSKGLEYPIVFCPFSWGSSSRSSSRKQEKLTFFHDRDRNNQPTCSLSPEPPPRQKEWAREEMLAEECRLLYVALTRARWRCYLVWGRFLNAEISALLHLFHDGALPEETNFLPDLERLVTGHEDCININPLPSFPDEPQPEPFPGAGESPLQYRRFRGTIDSSRGVTSATQMMHNSYQSSITEERDYDERHDEPPAGLALSAAGDDDRQKGRAEQTRQYPLPFGAQSGIMLHDIFQAVDFQRVDSDATREVITEKVSFHGFSPGLIPEIQAMLTRVTTAPLAPGGLRLADVPMKDRVDELSFYYPVSRLDGGRFGDILRAHGDGNPLYTATADRLAFRPVSGFVRGFIDMVWRFQDRYYLLDWKSNYLGPGVSDYRRTFLDREILESLYVVQYLVYTLAVDQYLALKIPGYRYDRHFGGVYYLFLRGIFPDEGTHGGVYYDLPPKGLIDALGDILVADRRGIRESR